MKRLMYVTAAAAVIATAAFFALTGGATAHTERPAMIAGVQATVTVSTLRVVHVRDATRACERHAYLPVDRASPIRLLAHAGVAYRAWAVGLWSTRLSACERTLERTLPLTNDWQTAVQIVQRVYPGSSGWLLNCSASEGGYGAFVWIGRTTYPRFGANDTPGGNMQYKQPTFNGDFAAAMLDLNERGIRVPPQAKSYYHPEGQAIAAGWARTHGNWAGGKWTGSGCG